MNNVDEVTASRLIFALMRVFSASVAEMPRHWSTKRGGPDIIGTF